MRLLDRLCTLTFLALAVSAAPCQSLAHKGWVGNGITVEPWWAGAVLYQIDPFSFQDTKGDGFGDLEGITQRLDYLHSLSIDAIVLSPFQLQPEFGRNGTGPAFDAKYGTEENLDHLIVEAGRRKIRIFVDLPMTAPRSTQELVSVARFWLSRGIAGLRLTSDPHAPALSAAQAADRLRELRHLCETYVGQRVLFWDMHEPMPGAVASRSRRTTAPVLTGAQMQIDSRLATMPGFNPSMLRSALDAASSSNTDSTSVPVTDGPDRPRSIDRYGDGPHSEEIAKVLAAALLLSRGAPLLYFGQELGMATTPAPHNASPASVDPSPMQWGDEFAFTTGIPWMEMGRNSLTANLAMEDLDASSLLNWYRRLSALHHENAVLRAGTLDVIAQGNPDIVAWVRRPRDSASLMAPVVVVCNLTAHPLLVSVAADLRRVGVQTTTPMMRTLSSSVLTTAAKDPVSGPVSMNAISLPPYGVYVGELAHPAGLESASSPLTHSSHRAR